MDDIDNIYFDGTNFTFGKPNALITGIFDGESHILLGLIGISILYVAAYMYKRYDIALALYTIMVVGVFVDVYVRGILH